MRKPARCIGRCLVRPLRQQQQNSPNPRSQKLLNRSFSSNLSESELTKFLLTSVGACQKTTPAFLLNLVINFMVKAVNRFSFCWGMCGYDVNIEQYDRLLVIAAG